MKIYREHFGKKLRDAIKDAKLTQAKFAETIGVEPPAVSRWVNGVDFPDESRFPKICATLKVEPNYFGYSQTMSSNDFLRLLIDLEDVLPSLRSIPKDILLLLSKQDSTYFETLRASLLKNST